MSRTLCPGCHTPVPDDELLRCRLRDGVAFLQCPECGACLPLPAGAAEPVGVAADAVRQPSSVPPISPMSLLPAAV